MVTAGGLVFISGAADKKLWAFDKMTGDLIWEKIYGAFGWGDGRKSFGVDYDFCVTVKFNAKMQQEMCMTLVLV